MPQLKGVIKTPTGEPLGGATITLTSLHNRAGILKGVFSHVTTQNGEYNFPVLPGVYSVRLTQSVQRLSEIGVIRVYEDSADGSLNDFLGATDIDLRPESLKKYEELAQQAQQSAEAAAESEQQAGQHADAAAREKEEVKNLAEGVQQNADAVAEGKQQAENLASRVEDTAAEVRQDAEAAKKAASDAEHVREDIDTALSATLKTANRLSELADEGEEAQQESRDNLGLKSAATMTPQSDIRDRTEGRLATPGAFGFGHIFLPAERIRFNTEDDFLSWARNATPGEYFVDGGSKIISGGVLFNGVVSIRWVEARNNPPEPRYTAKVIIFYGINGDVYYSRYWTTGNGYLTGWERLKLGETGIADTLRSIAGRANNYGYPGIGGVVFAAYCINDMDEDGRIFRGSGVSGSRLAAISVTAPYSHNGLSTSTPQIVIAPPSAYPMAGTFVALSGEPTTKVSAGTSITGLFVRIM
ncbi:prophage tail fiber N-terminal domain-containing protein [Escherichia albertii]|uniref:prophage tail fiber N-terminal domain-containing protein n=1 Tax=Escherichia albertii TaxID=208962 RepID=UPI0021D4966F|nr:prophage tail fiber N-terminal domain-containing protein [Escherichia albertii]MCU7294812.1 prophage tail fiber N-terminal domain-containing protein [Escherichia albertii]